MSDETAEIGNNLRHFSAARFARLNECLIANAALLGAMQLAAFQSLTTWLPALGLIVTLAFWLMCERAASYYWAFRRYEENAERTSMYRRLPRRRALLNTSTAMRVLFSALTFMWALLELFATAWK